MTSSTEERKLPKRLITLFKIGFYLLNLGFALYILRIATTLHNAQETIEALSAKVGGFSIYLGVMLFFNMYLFFRGKRVAKHKRVVPAVSNQPVVS